MWKIRTFHLIILYDLENIIQSMYKFHPICVFVTRICTKYKHIHIWFHDVAKASSILNLCLYE